MGKSDAKPATKTRSASTTKDLSQVSSEAKKPGQVDDKTREHVKAIEGNYKENEPKAADSKKLELGDGELLRRGSDGDQVKQVQEMLNQKGAGLDVDGALGPKTQDAIRDFQQKNNLQVDGIVGPETQGALNKAGAAAEKPATDKPTAVNGVPPGANGEEVDPNKGTPGAENWQPKKGLELDAGQTLRRGAEGDKVGQLQEMLNKGGAGLDVDGELGPKTQNAIRDFQREHGLKADGVVGPDTLAALNSGKPGQTPGADAKPTKPVDSGPTPPAGPGKFSQHRDALNGLPPSLRKYADTFMAAGNKYGVDPRFLAAISMHETGKGTSSAFRNKNNAMGISGRSGPLRMSSVEASIDKMAKGLASPTGYYRGKTTIGRIGSVYAPIGAGNDPNGLNGYWAKGVGKYYSQLGGNPAAQVIFR